MRKVSKKQKERNEEKVKQTYLMHQLFKEIWDEREDESGNCYCFESGQVLPGYLYRSNAACYDHVLEKSPSSYPEYSMNKNNIIIIHPDIHHQKGKNIEKCPRIKQYRDYLLSLHQEDKLKDWI